MGERIPDRGADRNSSVPNASRLRVMLWVLAILTTFTLQFVVFGEAYLDDAFITYRYGQNLALGRGLVFNEGEYVLGTTSPGTALVAAMAYAAVGRDLLPVVMNALSCLGWTASALFMFHCLAEGMGRMAAGTAALAVALGTFQAAHVMGLETNLVYALILLALLCLRKQREHAAAWALGAAILLRHDAVLAMLPAVVLVAPDRRKRAIQFGGLALIPTLAWLVFASLYYGDPLPNTLAAKSGMDPPLVYLGYLFRRLFMTLVPYAWGWPGAVTAWVGAGFAAYHFARRDRILLALVGHAALVLVAYSILRPGWRYHWHVLPAATTLGALLVALPVDLADQYRTRVGRVASVATSAGMIALSGWWPIDFAQKYPEIPWIGARHRAYVQMAEYMRKRSAPTDVVLAEEVGTLAYYSDLPAIDHPGLISQNPEREIRKWLDGKPTHLRWLVANQSDLAAKQQVFGFRSGLVFPREHPRYLLVDLRAVPRGR